MHGWFGFEEERVFPATIRMNKKGGMTNNDLDRYIKNSVVSLFPDLVARILSMTT